MLSLCTIGAYEHLPSTPEAAATMKTLRRAFANRTTEAQLLEAKILLEGAWSRTNDLASWLLKEQPSLTYLAVAVAQPRSQPDRVLLAQRSSVAGRWRTFACLDSVLTALDGEGSRPSTLVLDACLSEDRLNAVLARHPTVRIVTAIQAAEHEYPVWPAGCVPHQASPMAQFLADVLRMGPSWLPQLSVAALADMIAVATEPEGGILITVKGPRYESPLVWSEGSVSKLRDDDADRLTNESRGSREDAIQELAVGLLIPERASESRFNLAHLAATDPASEVRASARHALTAPSHGALTPRHKRSETSDLMPDWVWIPAGTAIVGSTSDEPGSLPEEQPQHAIFVPSFAIGRAPVSVAEFRAFQGACAPGDPMLITLGAPTPEDDRLPMTGVSWFDAVAYCQWVDDCLRQAVSLPRGHIVDLPSEPEWERAARANRPWAYPWGDTFEDNRANVRSSGIGTVAPSGSFSPAGDSPFGVQDMAGNVFEWTRSAWGHSRHNPDFAYPYDVKDGRERRGMHIEARRVVRGGAHYYYDDCVRVATRNFFLPWIRHSAGGFRIVLREADHDGPLQTETA